MTTLRRLAILGIGLVGLAGAAAPAHALPAFARKYGMKCTACHESWPVLNAVGRAFRDNGFRFNNGRDNETLTDPGYWPIFSWNWTGYQANEKKSADAVLNKTGGITTDVWIIGAAASLGEHISVRVFAPLVVGNGPSTFAAPVAGWLRYNRLFNTEWLNVSVGNLEQDLPIEGFRDFSVNGVGSTLWSYVIPGSVSSYSPENDVQGIEIMGHDRGSTNRYSVTFFSNEGAFATHHDFWSTPSVFGHVTHTFQLPSSFVRDVEVGVFGAYTTWGVGHDSTSLRAQKRYGVDVSEWLFNDALPLHLTEAWEQGRDDAGLIAGATRDGVFNAYMFQADYVPALSFVIFGRASFITTQQQAVATQTGAYGNQNIFLLGFKYSYQITTRFGVAIEPSYGLNLAAHGAPDGTNLQTHQFYIPLEVVF